MNNSLKTVLSLHNYKWLGVNQQLLMLASLFIINLYKDYRIRFSSQYFIDGIPINHFAVFAPIYEEIIFRGVLLTALIQRYSLRTAILISSVLFGIWHLKNVFFLNPESLLYQVIYASFFIGPVLAVICLKTKSIWPAVIVHFTNNILSPVSLSLLENLLKSL